MNECPRCRTKSPDSNVTTVLVNIRLVQHEYELRAGTSCFVIHCLHCGHYYIGSGVLQGIVNK